MIIALDWDNTYTRDTKFWDKFLALNAEWGNTIYIVTSRGMDTPIEFIPTGVDGVIYCNYRAKKDVTRQSGIDIQIWIDDDPYYITTGFITDDPPVQLLKEV